MADHAPTKPGDEPGASSSRRHHHGLVLLPPPSDDPRDPLRWPKGIKIAALLATAIANFTANFAATGLSVAAQVLAMQYQKSATDVNALLSVGSYETIYPDSKVADGGWYQFNLLFLGVGNLVWVPLGVKFGKRFSLITSMAIHFIVLVWTAKADGFNSLFAARCLSGLAGGAGEVSFLRFDAVRC